MGKYKVKRVAIKKQPEYNFFYNEDESVFFYKMKGKWVETSNEKFHGEQYSKEWDGKTIPVNIVHSSKKKKKKKRHPLQGIVKRKEFKDWVCKGKILHDRTSWVRRGKKHNDSITIFDSGKVCKIFHLTK